MTGKLSSDSAEAALALVDAAATEALGAAFGARLGAGDALLVYGELGAGKTTLARGAVSSFVGRPEEAPSPTYTLVQTYEGPRGQLWHVDLYRLTQSEEAAELGLEEAFEEAAVIVEWPERLARLPARRVEIRLAPAGAGRSARLTAHGGALDLMQDVLHELPL